jgi:hypothetical protein
MRWKKEFRQAGSSKGEIISTAGLQAYKSRGLVNSQKANLSYCCANSDFKKTNLFRDIWQFKKAGNQRT